MSLTLRKTKNDIAPILFLFVEIWKVVLLELLWAVSTSSFADDIAYIWQTQVFFLIVLECWFWPKIDTTQIFRLATNARFDAEVSDAKSEWIHASMCAGQRRQYLSHHICLTKMLYSNRVVYKELDYCFASLFKDSSFCTLRNAWL